VPGIFADENRGTPPWRVERPHFKATLYEPLLVEEPVRWEKVLPMDVENFRLPATETDVRGAVVQRVSPLLVEAQHDVHRLRLAQRLAIRRIEVTRELAGGDRQISNAPFHEVSRRRGLGELYHGRPGRQCGGAREQAADAGDVRGVVAFTRPELDDRQVERRCHAERCHRLAAIGMPNA
jgi:hypothetical protein